MLSDCNVALGVTGSVAAVRTVELAHELARRGATVRALMTPAATNIIHPWAVEFATDAEPVTEIGGCVEHVEWCGREGWADVLLIAPATANTVGKLAAGIDDTPVTTAATTAIGADMPVVIAPAMHEPMYDHPGILDAIEQLESWGLSFVSPRLEEGKAKIATIDAIATETGRAAGARPLTDDHIIITAGGTVAPIDPVRVLTNRASGRMGRELARACYRRGATVTLVHGPIGPRPVSESGLDTKRDDPALPYLDTVEVTDTTEMTETVLDLTDNADCLISAAAVGDYTTTYHNEKLSSGQHRTLELSPTSKLIDQVRERAPELPIVGFKTESTDDQTILIEAARDTQSRADLACVVANPATTMGSADADVIIVDEETTTSLSGPKPVVADGIIADLTDRLHKRSGV